MKRTILALIASANIFSACAMPAMAHTNELIKDTVLLPARTLSLATGLTVGTPVAILRKSVANINTITNDIAPGDNVIPKMVAAGLVGIPFGVASGIPQGAYCGSKNALVNCVNKPFSAESFSFQEL